MGRKVLRRFQVGVLKVQEPEVIKQRGQKCRSRLTAIYVNYNIMHPSSLNYSIMHPSSHMCNLHKFDKIIQEHQSSR